METQILGYGIVPTSSGTYYDHGGNNLDFQSWFFINPEKKYGIVYFPNCDKAQSTPYLSGKGPFFSGRN